MKNNIEAKMLVSGGKSAEQHARILSAYLGRLSLQGLKQIYESQMACWDAQARYGMSSQLKAQDQAFATVKEVMGRTLRSDLDNIERIVERVEGRGAAVPTTPAAMSLDGDKQPESPAKSLRDAAQALLNAFGGDVPSWLREEAVALENALGREVAAGLG